MISDDKYIELIVAGINQLSMPAADIQHDVIIGGRQFDVIAQLEAGLHKILLAYEVKNKSRRVSVDQIDGFVTKAQDAKADKAIFVSTAGFQSGCFTVADRHGVELFQLTFLDQPLVPKTWTYSVISKSSQSMINDPPKIELGIPKPIICVPQVALFYHDGKRFVLPDEPSQMRYYMERTTVSVNLSLNEIISMRLPSQMQVGDRKTIKISPIPAQSSNISPPDEFFFPAGKLEEIEFECEGVLGTPILGNTEIETSALSFPVQYKNIKTGEEITSEISNIPVGPSELSVGHFYFGYFPLRYIYCDGFEGDLLRIYLVESFQMGQLVQVVWRQEAKYSRFYIPVTDKRTVDRLKERLRRMQTVQSS